MKKDIEFLKVKDLAVAIVPENEDPEFPLYTAYLINRKKTNLQGVFVRIKGSGIIDGEKVETATIRVFFENVAPNTFVKIDDFEAQAASLSNEYWVSFKENNYLFDKKYIFVPESIVESNFTEIPILGKKGVLIS